MISYINFRYKRTRMFYIIISAAGVLFLTHVWLLLTAFPKFELAKRRYFYSHLTLWLTGLLLFILTIVYSGAGKSGFIDYFNSPLSKVMILVFTIALSLVAHGIVKIFILPIFRKQAISE